MMLFGASVRVCSSEAGAGAGLELRQGRGQGTACWSDGSRLLMINS